MIDIQGTKDPAKTLRSLVLVIASTLVAVLAAEALLRAAGQSYYWAYAKRPDPLLGWRPPPNSRGWQRFEGAALVATNDLGFRDRDHDLIKPDDVLRVAVLGDSFSEAVQVPVEQNWWWLMAESLNSRGCGPFRADPAMRSRVGELAQGSPPGAMAVEVMSFAVSGYSTAQSLLAWREIASNFVPDVVVLAFFIGNDLNENHPALNEEPLRPYLRPDPDPGAEGLVLDTSFRDSPAYGAARAPLGRFQQWLREHSRIVQLLLQARDAMRIRSLGQNVSRAAPDLDDASAEGRRESPPLPQEPGVDNAVFAPPTTVAWRETWQATAEMLGAFADETRAAGAEPVLMLIGTGGQVHPNAAGRARFAAALGLKDLGYPVRRLLRIADRHQLPVINLPARWTRDANGQQSLRHGFAGGQPGFGHWNAVGHRAAADAVAELLCWREAEKGGQGQGGIQDGR